jgi:hypothetical protein
MDIGLLIPQYNSPVVDGFALLLPGFPTRQREGLPRNRCYLQHKRGHYRAHKDASFRLSYSNMNQKGMVPNTDYIKNTVALGASANPTTR